MVAGATTLVAVLRPPVRGAPCSCLCRSCVPLKAGSRICHRPHRQPRSRTSARCWGVISMVAELAQPGSGCLLVPATAESHQRGHGPTEPTILRRRPGTALRLPHRRLRGSVSCSPCSRGSRQAWSSASWWPWPGRGRHWHRRPAAPWAGALLGPGWRGPSSRPMLEAAAHIWQTAAEWPRGGSCRLCRCPAALPCPAWPGSGIRGARGRR